MTWKNFRGDRQKDAQRKEKEQIGERNQPDKMASHQIEAVGFDQVLAEHPNSNFQPSGEEAATSGERDDISDTEARPRV